MANPSLQIGDSNWAIKEDNLLGYSKAGTRFVPEPITMTRESAGTRVNPEGLVETVELLGSELVDCGGFECATPLTYWTEAGLASIGGGVASFVNDGTGVNSYIQQDILTAGKTYKVSFDVTRYVEGRLQIVMGSTAYTTDITDGVGTYTFYLEAISTGIFRLKRQGGYNFDFDIDNVSAKEYTANNLARVDYDGTASSLLAEPERTNLLKYSEDFSEWNMNGTSVVDGGVSSIGLNYYTITNTGGGFLGVYYASAGFSHGDTITTSVYVKKGTSDDFRLRYGASINQNVDFNLDDGTVVSEGTNVVGTIQSMSDGWYRVTSTWTDATHTFSVADVALYVASGNVEISGAQLEVGSYATSYIPTDDGTVTRVKDQYEKTGISNLIGSEGVLYAEFKVLHNYQQQSISISDGTINTRVLIYATSGGLIRGQIKGSTTVGVNDGSGATATDFNKVAIRYKDNQVDLSVNGATIVTSTTANTAPTTLNQLHFTAGTSSAAQLDGQVRIIQIYDTWLTDSELTTLTT